jgi:histidyl-tRNA synthetase
MAAQKPSIPKGTRDFSPNEMVRRTYIFETIKKVFRKYGFMPIETPTMENLSTLTGKYGDEGDQLIFKVLNSGDYLAKADEKKLANRDSKYLTSEISEKALRYDLTVPFARYVVMNQNDITFPFKRYQVQPVWRADKPQKGRYREFYQCDADVIGSTSLVNEAELVLIYDEALSNLGLPDFSIKINNRKILSGIAEVIGEADKIVNITVAIDKLDKIGVEGVNKELTEKGVSDKAIALLQPIIALTGTNEQKLTQIKEVLKTSEIGLKGIEELEQIFNLLKLNPVKKATIELDITLARGLNYYTGAIFEVKANGVQMGSIGGGGRYDDLTGIFGLPNVSGVGVSFGADRIYDVIEELNLFPSFDDVTTKVLFTNFDAESESYAFPLVGKVREMGINAELYPSSVKLKKQMDYADKKGIPFVVLIGSDEMASGLLTIKDMKTGAQEKLTIDEIINKLK